MLRCGRRAPSQGVDVGARFDMQPSRRNKGAAIAKNEARLIGQLWGELSEASSSV